MTKDIVIMAKSIKHYPNYCIAGIDIESGEWIRPVSNDSQSEYAVLKDDAIYEDGTEVNILDVVRIEFVKYAPNYAQKENYQYDSQKCWKKIGKMTLEEVVSRYSVDDPKFVFTNNNNSLFENELTGTSLLLVQIQNPIINVHAFPDKVKISLIFSYKGKKYRFIQICDPLLSPYKQKKDGNYRLKESRFAVFSLTGRYEKDDKFYKILAHLF